MINLIGIISGPIVILGVVGMAFLTKPAVAHINSLEERSRAVGTMSLKDSPPEGATFVVYSMPVPAEIPDHMSKYIFKANILDNKDGYPAVILKKSANGTIRSPGVFYPDLLKSTN